MASILEPCAADPMRASSHTQLEGIAFASFDAVKFRATHQKSKYNLGDEYISVCRGQRLVKELGTETAQGWLRGMVGATGVEQQGWFPSTCWQPLDHALQLRRSNAELEREANAAQRFQRQELGQAELVAEIRSQLEVETSAAEGLQEQEHAEFHCQQRQWQLLHGEEMQELRAEFITQIAETENCERQELRELGAALRNETSTAQKWCNQWEAVCLEELQASHNPASTMSQASTGGTEVCKSFQDSVSGMHTANDRLMESEAAAASQATEAECKELMKELGAALLTSSRFESEEVAFKQGTQRAEESEAQCRLEIAELNERELASSFQVQNLRNQEAALQHGKLRAEQSEAECMLEIAKLNHSERASSCKMQNLPNQEVAFQHSMQRAEQSEAECRLQIASLKEADLASSKQVQNLHNQLQEAKECTRSELRATSEEFGSVLNIEANRCRDWARRLETRLDDAFGRQTRIDVGEAWSSAVDSAGDGLTEQGPTGQQCGASLRQSAGNLRSSMRNVEAIAERMLRDSRQDFATAHCHSPQTAVNADVSEFSCQEIVLPATEKFIFLVRHAQSTWNAKELSAFVQQDHALSALGEEQARNLRESIAREYGEGKHRIGADAAFYEALFSPKQERTLYSSPMLRALQTAHLGLPEEAGWNRIKLLPDAREVLQTILELDNIGAVTGTDLLDRAKNACSSAASPWREVDTSDCEQQWWSEWPETDEDQVDKRLRSLLHRLLDEDKSPSCVCVTHSNVIRRFMMQFGGVDVTQPDAEMDASFTHVDCEQGDLQRSKIKKLANGCMLGLRMRFDDGHWAAKEACLMFDSNLDE